MPPLGQATKRRIGSSTKRTAPGSRWLSSRAYRNALSRLLKMPPPKRTIEGGGPLIDLHVIQHRFQICAAWFRPPTEDHCFGIKDRDRRGPPSIKILWDLCAGAHPELWSVWFDLHQVRFACSKEIHTSAVRPYRGRGARTISVTSTCDG